MDEKCYLLYGVRNLLEFLSFDEKEKCKIFSMIVDSQKVFIVRFNDEDTAEKFENHIERPDYTLIGCVSYGRNDILKEETLLTLGDFINEHA